MRAALMALVTMLAAAADALADPPSCAARLETRETFARTHMLDFRCDCRCGGQGVPVLIELLDKQFGDTGPPPEIDQLFVGRLDQQLPEVAAALSLAASRTVAWDGDRGWRDPGYANGFVRDTLNARAGELYGDLAAAFARWDIRIEADSVEKVRMAVPADLAQGDRLLAAGADPRERVPFDGVTWFRLVRTTE